MATNITRNWMLTNGRLKKLKGVFPVDCDLRMNELWALRKIEQATQESVSGICNTEIQEDLQITKSAVSQMLDALFEKGYIERTLDVSDRRRMCVTITPAGKQVLKRMTAYANLLANKVSAKMGEEKIQHMFDLLNEFIDTSLEVAKETPYTSPSQKSTPDGKSHRS
jgi:DNA-binding MarR family transcriptional regulator